MKERDVKPWLLFVVFGMWALLTVYFSTAYVEMIMSQQRFVAAMLAALIVAWIVLASFFACYHVVSFIFSAIVRTRGVQCAKVYGSCPRVAVFYTCMNDLKEEAVRTCLDQEYANYDLFILDDSSDPAEHCRVDSLQARFPRAITVIRRPTRSGFKAGNLNYALDQVGHRYAYFAVVDADELLPPDFLTETVAIAEADSSLGFVQASHETYGETEYAHRTGGGLDLHWDYFLPARNRFGFVYFYGHGALIRTQACLAAGGFPEIVSEDVGLAVNMRKAGYRGYYAGHVVCREELPRTYAAFRRRSAKVLRGTLEFLTKIFPGFARTKSVPFVEKLDLLIASSVLYLPIFFLGFVVLLHFVMPWLSRDTYSVALQGLPAKHFGYIRTSMSLFRPLWAWDGLCLTVFTIFAPLCYLIPSFLRAPFRVTLQIWRMTAVHLSGTIHATCETVLWLLTGKALFTATADRAGPNVHARRIRFEAVLGGCIFACSVLTGSLCLMAVGLSILMVPMLIKNDFRTRQCRALAMLPMALTLVALCTVPMGLLGVTGAFAGIAFAHH